MTDMCRVFVVGNFGADIVRCRQDDGTVYGTTILRVGRTDLVRGQPVTTTVSIPLVIIGASRVASIAQQFGAGSRVLIEGHLEARPPRSELVLVIDTILNAAQPLPTPEAQHQPPLVAWQEQP